MSCWALQRAQRWPLGARSSCATGSSRAQYAQRSVGLLAADTSASIARARPLVQSASMSARAWPPRGRWLLAATATLLLACDRRPPDAPADARGSVARAEGSASATRSNIFARDYVGPGPCGECHEEKVASWRVGRHATMTTDLADDPPRLLAADVTLAYGGGTMQIDHAAAPPTMTMTMTSATGVTRRYRVTRTIGSRALQEYVGVQALGPEPPGDPIYATEQRLPFGVWKRAGRWLPQPYFDSWYGAEHDARGEQRTRLTAPTRDAAALASIGERNHLPLGELVTVGISCESCHLGAREHVDGAAIAWEPVGAGLERSPLAAAPRQAPAVIGAICGQCHSTPAATFPSGAVARNSAESTDQAGGACASALRCIDCHDPHVESTADRPALEARAIAACVRCHPQLATPAQQFAHAGHDAAAASCLDCHTPRLVQGLDRQTRSHHIGSPRDASMLVAAAPNACNLCHLDQSIAWTLSNLEVQYGGARVVPPAMRAAYGGSLERPVGEVWLASASRDTRLAAVAAYGRRGGPAALAALLPVLDAPVAYERMWTLFAVENVLGRRLALDEYDPLAAPVVRAAQAAALPGRLAAR
jgi:predicted CXXCH cytochrome family protein